MRGAVWKDICGAFVMQRAAHLLVLFGGDLLKEVGRALARRQPEAQRLEEGHHLLAGPMVHQAACKLCSYGSKRTHRHMPLYLHVTADK